MMRSVEQDKSSCSVYPDMLDIEFSNRFWQLFKSHNQKETFFLYGAYLDNRKALKKEPLIRILAMSNSRYLISSYVAIKLKISKIIRLTKLIRAKYYFPGTPRWRSLSVTFGTAAARSLLSVRSSVWSLSGTSISTPHFTHLRTTKRTFTSPTY